MQSTKSSDFVHRFSELLDSSPLTDSDISQRLGVSKQSVSAWKTGVRSPKKPMILHIASVFGVSELWLMGFDVDKNAQDPSIPPGFEPMPKTRMLPVIGTIACGTPILAEENIEEYLSAPDEIHADFILRCKGDSMIGARIHDGDIVYIRSQPDVEHGEIAAVTIDGEATLKRVMKYPNKIVLMPANPEYEPLVFVGEEIANIRIEGKAVGFFSSNVK